MIIAPKRDVGNKFAPAVQAHYDCGMPDESDPIIRKTVSLPASLWQRIEDFQFEARVKRDTQAVRRLIEIGLEAHALDHKKTKTDR